MLDVASDLSLAFFLSTFLTLALHLALLSSVVALAFALSSVTAQLLSQTVLAFQGPSVARSTIHVALKALLATPVFEIIIRPDTSTVNVFAVH